MRKITVLVAALAMLMTMAGSAFAYTLNPNGTGFVGKGEVQTAFGWNNSALQRNADGVSFAYESVTAQETTWECRNTNNQNVQERSRTTTTSTQGVVSNVARERNQITGFNLTGFAGAPTETSASEGNQLFSCPTNWVLENQEVGEPETISGGLYAIHNGRRELLP